MTRKDINTNKLSNLVSLITIMLIVAYAAIFGVFFYFNVNFIDLLIAVISIPLSFLIGVVMHELGHFIFGLISGYKPVFFQILCFKFVYTSRNRFHLRIVEPNVLGQCMMSYDTDIDKTKYKLYLYGGSIMNLFLVFVPLIANILIFIFKGHINYFYLALSVVNISLFLSNGIPLNIGNIYNDTLNIKLMNKYENVKHGILNTLKIQELTEKGVLINDIPTSFIENDNLTLESYNSLNYPFMLYKTMKAFKNNETDPFRYALTVNTYKNFYPRQYNEVNIAIIMVYDLLNNIDARWILASKEYKNIFKKGKKEDQALNLSLTLFDYKYNGKSLDETIALLNKNKEKIDMDKSLPIEKEFVHSLYKYVLDYITPKEENINE